MKDFVIVPKPLLQNMFVALLHCFRVSNIMIGRVFRLSAKRFGLVGLASVGSFIGFSHCDGPSDDEAVEEFPAATERADSWTSEEQRSATSHGSLEDLKLEREAEEIIKDADCPECLREALKGPCGGVFLNLFRCSNSKTEEEMEAGACTDTWDAFGQCVQANYEFYDARRRAIEALDRDENNQDTEVSVDSGDSSIEASAKISYGRS